VAIGSLEALKRIALVEIPDSDALVKQAGGDVLRVGRESNTSDVILGGQSQRALASVNIPQADGSVTAARRKRATVAGEVQRVDILFMTLKDMIYLSRCNIPDLGLSVDTLIPRGIEGTYSNQFIFPCSGEILAVGAEADASDIEVVRHIS